MSAGPLVDGTVVLVPAPLFEAGGVDPRTQDGGHQCVGTDIPATVDLLEGGVRDGLIEDAGREICPLLVATTTRAASETTVLGVMVMTE